MSNNGAGTNTVALVKGPLAAHLRDALLECSARDDAAIAAFPPAKLIDEGDADDQVGIAYVDRATDGAIQLNLGEYCMGDVEAAALLAELDKSPEAHVVLRHGDGSTQRIAEVRTDWEGTVEMHAADREATPA